MRRLLALACLCLGAAAATAQAPATPAAAPPWLQYELLVFRQPPAPDDGELWPEKPALGYPPQVEPLLEPGSPAHAAALQAREFEQSLAAEAGSAAGGVVPQELPRTLLQGIDTVLSESAARLSRGGYRVLAHYAWRQPPPQGAESLLVTGGSTVGEHHELEGYLTLTRTRFLHVDARLWLNDFPAPGTDPAAATVELPPVPVPRVEEPAALPAEPAGGLDGSGSLATGDAAAAGAGPIPEIAVEPQRASRTVVLEASRRLAPGELHYVDHPLFGLILTVRPYDPAQPAGVPPGDASAPPVPAAPGA